MHWCASGVLTVHMVALGPAQAWGFQRVEGRDGSQACTGGSQGNVGTSLSLQVLRLPRKPSPGF